MSSVVDGKDRVGRFTRPLLYTLLIVGLAIDTYSKPTKEECFEMFKMLKNKDELSHSCKEMFQALTSGNKGVMENHPLNVRGGSRQRNGISHAALQRRFTGKMSGVHLST